MAGLQDRSIVSSILPSYNSAILQCTWRSHARRRRQRHYRSRTARDRTQVAARAGGAARQQSSRFRQGILDRRRGYERLVDGRLRDETGRRKRGEYRPQFSATAGRDDEQRRNSRSRRRGVTTALWYRDVRAIPRPVSLRGRVAVFQDRMSATALELVSPTR